MGRYQKCKEKSSGDKLGFKGQVERAKGKVVKKQKDLAHGPLVFFKGRPKGARQSGKMGAKKKGAQKLTLEGSIGKLKKRSR